MFVSNAKIDGTPVGGHEMHHPWTTNYTEGNWSRAPAAALAYGSAYAEAMPPMGCSWPVAEYGRGAERGPLLGDRGLL